MQIRCSKKGCKNHETCSKMHPKWEPKSIQNLKNAGKNGIRKLMPKFDTKKIKTNQRKDFLCILDRSQLPTAIFPHRALEKRKREVKTSFGLCFEWIQKDYNRNCYKMHVKIIIFGPKTFKISSNWHPKSMSKP